MGVQTAALLIFFISLCSIAVIVWRKIPLLLEAREDSGSPGIAALVAQSANKLRGSDKFKNINADKALQKTLSKTRILALKTENKTGTWLQQLRKKSDTKKQKFSENYWDQFKKGSK